MRTMLLDRTTGAPLSWDTDLFSWWRQHEESVLWLDLDGSNPEEEGRLLRDVFHLHPLAVQDALSPRHPPKVEFFGEVMFLLLRGLDAYTDSIEFNTIQLAVFSGPRFLVTRHSGPSPSTDWLWQRLSAQPDVVARGTTWLVLELMNRVVRRYIPILLNLEPRLEELEREIFTAPKRTDAIIEELTGYKTSLKRMRRIIAYHQQVAEEMARTPQSQLPQHLSHEVRDICEQLQRSVTLADLYIDLAGDQVDASLAIASHRLNQIFRILTIITVIFVPLSFLAGIYGMNFENMPELAISGGYHTLLTVMAVIVLIQLWIFRRKQWL